MPQISVITGGGTKEYRPVVHLQTIRPTPRLVLPDDRGTKNASEARYWAEKFGLGVDNKHHVEWKKYAHFRCVELQAGTSSIVHEIVLGATATAENVQKSSHQMLAAICGPRVPLYGTTLQSDFHRLLRQHDSHTSARSSFPTNVQPDRQVPTGGELATAGALRVDGRLLAIGTAQGSIRIADTTTRATLSTIRQQQQKQQQQAQLAIRKLQWFRDGKHLLATGDDAVLRVWNIKSTTSSSEGKPVLECIGHGDVVRASDLYQRYASETSTRTCWAITGSYDHTVRLWNVDPEVEQSTQQRCLAVMEHGAPVEAVLFATSTHPQIPIWIVSVGGTCIKVWNPLSGKCVCECNAQHRKTITSMIMIRRKINDESTTSFALRLVTAGLDGLLRIHTWNSATGEIHQIHGVSVLDASGEKASITALAANKSGDRIAIGFATGSIAVRQMGPSVLPRKRTRPPPAGTYAFFQRGKNANPIDGEYILKNTPKKRKLTKYDTALKQFRYADALDEALGTRIPAAVVAVIEELGKRRGLRIALSNRDEETLEPIMAFLVKYMTRPRFSAILVGVANKIIDIYGNVAGQSEVIDELFKKLKEQVVQECKTQKLLLRLVGQIDAIVATKAMDVNP